MGISSLTAFIIQDRGEDILVQAGGPDPATGKYVGWISLQEGHRGPRPLLSTEPIYATKEEATAAMEKIVADVRKTTIIEGAQERVKSDQYKDALDEIMAAYMSDRGITLSEVMAIVKKGLLRR